MSCSALNPASSPALRTMAPNPSPAGLQPSPQRFYGKYSGEVLENVDELGIYRLKVKVPTVPATFGGVWARPCVPYFGDGVGFFAIPPIGARVWVEFEAGNPNLPIWVGGFWDEGQFRKPLEEDALSYPAVKLWQTASCRLMLRDQDGDGEVLLEISDPAVKVPVKMKFFNEGVLLETGDSKMTVNPESGFVLTVGKDTRLSLSPEGINMLAPEITGKAEGELSMDAGGVLNAKAGEDANLGAGGAMQMEVGGELGANVGGLGKIDTTGDLTLFGDAVTINSGVAMELGAGAALDVNAGGAVAVLAGAELEQTATLNANMNAATVVVDSAMDVNGLLLEDGDPVLVAPV